MEFFPSPKVFLQIGPFSIAWYAICIMIGGIFGCSVSARELKKNGYSTETIEDLFMGAFICGIIGARLWPLAGTRPTTLEYSPPVVLAPQAG